MLYINLIDTAHRRLMSDVETTVWLASALRRLDTQRHRPAVINIQAQLESQERDDHIDEARYLFVQAFGAHDFQHSTIESQAHASVIAQVFEQLQVHVPFDAVIDMLFGGRSGRQAIKNVRFDKHELNYASGNCTSQYRHASPLDEHELASWFHLGDN